MSSGEQERNSEILRLRDRVHALEASVRGLTWRLRLQGEQYGSSINQLRGDVEEIGLEVKEIRREVSELLRADEIADAVAERMKERNAILSTWPRRIGAALAGALVLAESMKGLFGL